MTTSARKHTTTMLTGIWWIFIGAFVGIPIGFSIARSFDEAGLVLVSKFVEWAGTPTVLGVLYLVGNFAFKIWKEKQGK